MSTKAVANFVIGVSLDKLPLEVVTKAKMAIRDNIGVILAAHNDRAVQAARRMVVAMGGKGESTIVGIDTKAPCNLAAFVNAVMASTLDMDDGSMGLSGHLRMHRGHPGGIVIPSSLAVAERQNASGKAFIEAVVAGYEVALATAWMLGEMTGETFLAGRTGTYGAAAAAVKLLGLNPEEVINTFNIAETHCPFPSYAFLWTQIAMTKEAPAWAAMTGVTAGLLAQSGFSGRPTIYDLPESNKKPIETLGKEWEILGLYFKPYSACRLCHAPIDGILEIAKEYNLDATNISKITVGCSQRASNMSNYRPANIWQAQYSIPFTMGVALVDGEVGPEQISENRLGDKAILCQADKVKLVADSEVDALLSGILGARVTVEAKGSRNFQTLKLYPKGEPENPLNEEELNQKFMRLATTAMGPSRAGDLCNCLKRLEEVESIATLVEKIKCL